MSKKQWIGLVILLLMVAAVELCAWLTNRWQSKQFIPDLLVLQPEREEAFSTYLDSLSQAEYKARKAQYPLRYNKPEIHLQPFDPNTADSALLVTVGLKPWMAHNLIRYREAGKVFRQKADLQSLYGMTDSLYATLEPYIQLDTDIVDSLSNHSRSVVEPLPRVKRDTILELNTADTAELCLLRGVGRYTAVQIVRYRNALGGYYSLNQLYEIKQISHERIDSILPHLTVDATQITPMDINHASVRRLQSHPYISYQQAEKIYDLRRRKLRLTSSDELNGIFTYEELLLLAPYLCFSCD